MSERKTIAAYLEEVGAQIRWRRARPVVLQELERHLEDQRDAFAAEGREDPEALAVAEMGDPVSVGAELDLLHRPRPQWGLLLFTVLFAAAGAGLRLWLTRDFSISFAEKPHHVIAGFALGCLALFCGYFLDVGRLGRRPWLIYLGALAVSAASLAFSPGFNGASYYTRYVTLCFPVIYAIWLYGWRGRGWRGQAMAMLGIVPLAVICMMTPHLLALLLLFAAAFGMLLLAAAWDWFGIGKGKSLILPAAAAAGGLALLIRYIRTSGYLLSRLQTALHPETDPMGSGWAAIMMKQVLSVSHWLGEGSLGPVESYEKMVPDCDRSALLTTLIYRMGWLPFLLVALALTALLVWVFCRCLRQRSRFGRLVVLAVGMTLLGEAICSVAWNLGFTFLAADFPLVIGNLHTVLVMGLIGLALSAFRGDSIAREMPATPLRAPRVRIRLEIQKS